MVRARVEAEGGGLGVRGADAVPPGLTCSLPALWKGVLYDADARAGRTLIETDT